MAMILRWMILRYDSANPSLIAYLSQYITLNAGDLIYTGTPAGVGPIHQGDHLVGTLESHTLLLLDV